MQNIGAASLCAIFLGGMVYFLSMTPKLSIVIVNYRSEDALVDCLRSIHVATKQSVEIILVDNSVGGGADQVLAQSGLASHYFPQDSNTGYTRAANLGAQHAVGEYVCFLNPDIVLHAHALDRMLAWVETHPGTIVGPREIQMNGKITTTAFPFVTRRYIWGANLVYRLPWPDWFKVGFGWLFPPFRYTGLCQQATQPRRVPVLSGSCLVLARQSWETIGEWNEGLTYFGLESEWFERARALGQTAWYLPDATMDHLHGLSISRSLDGSVRREAEHNRRWFAKRKGWVTVLGLILALWIERRLRSGT